MAKKPKPTETAVVDISGTALAATLNDVESVPLPSLEKKIEDMVEANSPAPPDTEILAEHRQPPVSSEHGIPSVMGEAMPDFVIRQERIVIWDSVRVGMNVQYFTREAHRQVKDMGEGPYAATVTKITRDEKGNNIGLFLRVTAPYVSWDVPNAVRGDGSDPNVERWWNLL